MNYSDLIRSYVKDFVTKHPIDSLCYVKLLSQNEVEMVQTFINLIAGNLLIPNFFYYTSESAQNLAKPLSMIKYF